jgi:hypothetical protein
MVVERHSATDGAPQGGRLWTGASTSDSHVCCVGMRMVLGSVPRSGFFRVPDGRRLGPDGGGPATRLDRTLRAQLNGRRAG